MADEITIQQLKKVADLIGEPHPLGIELGIPDTEISNLVRPLEGSTQYGAKMLNQWYAGKANMTEDELKEELCKALTEQDRPDLARQVNTRNFRTENDIQKLFQYLTLEITKIWKYVGLGLHMKWADLDALDVSPKPSEYAVLTMLQKWKQRTSPQDQRTELINALRNLGNEKIIKAIGGEPKTQPTDSKMPGPHPHQPPQDEPDLAEDEPDLAEDEPDPTEDEPDLDEENAAAAGWPKKLKKLFKKHGFIPNTIMKDDLQHMVAELKKAHHVPKVLIAVLDSGIWADHPRLKAFLVKPSRNFVTGADADVEKDETNHGTIMAGILVEFAGICVEIVTFKVGSKRTWMRYQQAGMMAIKSWEKETNRKVDIVLTSINETESEYTVKDEFDKTLTDLAEERIIICSAANITKESGDAVRYPATHDHVLAIGSLDIKGFRSAFSTKGHALNFLFPGEQFQSTSRPPTFPGEDGIKAVNSRDDWMIDTHAGTSFASPHAAAAAAIILAYTEHTLGAEYRKGLTRSKTMQQLLITVCEQEHKVDTGYGYPQLWKIDSAMIKKKVDKMCKNMKVPTRLVLS